jgi:hypothetical protein
MKTPWAVILCKFTDGNDEPFPKQHYRDLFTANDVGSPWNMVRYFRDYSHGRMDLGDTQVFGWYHLNKSLADYNKLEYARNHLIQWARDAAAAHGVDLTPFYSVVVCTNFGSDIGAAPGGVVAQGSKTQIPRLLGHEMGHVYGLQHSRIDGSDDDYKDPWDIMSAAADFTATDGEFDLIGPGVNAWNMRSRGWLDESRVWKQDGDCFDETVQLRPLHRRDLPGFVAAETPDGYLVEYRVPDAWDGGIPRAAVLVHRFDGGHSYLVRGNSGSRDIVAGDSFGDPEPAQELLGLVAFRRIDVLAIDAAAQEATVRMRSQCVFHPSGQAVDPMYLVLSHSAYQVWVERRHPHVPRLKDIQAAFREMTPGEQDAAVARARAMVDYGQAVVSTVAGNHQRTAWQRLLARIVPAPRA